MMGNHCPRIIHISWLAPRSLEYITNREDRVSTNNQKEKNNLCRILLQKLPPSQIQGDTYLMWVASRSLELGCPELTIMIRIWLYHYLAIYQAESETWRSRNLQNGIQNAESFPSVSDCTTRVSRAARSGGFWKIVRFPIRPCFSLRFGVDRKEKTQQNLVFHFWSAFELQSSVATIILGFSNSSRDRCVL